ncbi:SPFH domain-containing protein [Ornithinimicrobium tianjinense]|uniref:Band 7 domain-containing protein n=1 Tax=Ornithinimicrobium tianjinense TaxID=1195761 RepID=A0A917F7A1_9MICO|nr:SPFH domain-containing protein [Ornithinimicrobium tianjinense]GGF54206.1 hypothetical protein GCM10011366_22560 [Ornithinimicrobium tianjinense]
MILRRDAAAETTASTEGRTAPQRRRLRWGLIIAGMVAGLLAVVGLGSAATAFQSAQSGEVGVVQNGYILIPTDPNLMGCIAPETTQNQFTNDVFWYPARQISWDATGGEGAERTPYVVVSNASAPAELTVPVVVTMDLTQDCDALMDFHRNMGTKYSAWMDSERQPSDGWTSLLNYAVGQPTEVTLVRLAQKYPWQEIWNDETIRAEFEKTLAAELPKRIQDRTGGEYFTNIQVTVGKPDPVNDELKAAIAREQTAVAEANAKREAADADLAVAESETKVAKQRALQQQAEIEGYPSVEDYLRAQLIDQGGNPYQPTVVWPGAPSSSP